MNGTYSTYVKYAKVVADIGFLSATICCSILIYLTIFKVKRNFGSYTYLLVLFPALGIFFATLEIVLYPNVFHHDASYVFYSTSRPFGLGKDAVTIALGFYGVVYAFTVSMLSVQFLYRYWAIFRETKLLYFKGWRFFIWIIYSSFFGFLWGYGLVLFNELDEYSRSYINESMREKFGIDVAELSGTCLVAYTPDNSVRWWNVFATLNMSFVASVQYTLIIYCAVRMYLGMDAKIQMLSASLRVLHRQFFKTLVLQMVSPTITLFAPALLIIYLPLFNLKIDLPTGIFLCAFTLYPAMDSMIVVYVVKDYRKAVRSTFKDCITPIYSWLTRGEANQKEQRTRSNDIPLS
ncbi:hypothetical protein B9Z55_018401 [Caenorhabditis nigoni]|uniref:Seven TM Receptor n=1 Tax=Caenorhabditis nigoni TaxID=1611254 RepID=A0A2G5TDQ6_9PELO|nr:hypothetical protein B9Z55_018401 [Caenorhabditis nigoni]